MEADLAAEGFQGWGQYHLLSVPQFSISHSANFSSLPLQTGQNFSGSVNMKQV